MGQPSNSIERTPDTLSGPLLDTKKKLIIISVVVIVLAGLYLLSRYNYPLFHSAADMATIFIAASVFVVVWNRRKLLDNHFYLFVGIAFLFFALLDFLHLLGNKGMGVFSPQYGNLGPDFYIASRYVLSLSLVLAPLFIKRKFNTTLVFGVYAVVTILIVLSILEWQNFPVTYIEGQGLTHFKIISDYIICLVLAGAIASLVINRRMFDARVLRRLIYALSLSIATGLAFTLYTDPFGLANVIGHFFQIASFYLIYRVFVETILNEPQDILYRNLARSKEEGIKLNAELEKANLQLRQDISSREKAEKDLKESEERFSKAFKSSPTAMAITKVSDGTYIDINNSYERLTGFTRQEIIGHKTTEFDVYVYPEQRNEIIQQLNKTGKLQDKEFTFRKKDGQLIETLCSLETFNIGGQNYFLSSLVNITERKQSETALRQYARELEAANKDLESFSYTVSHDLRAPLRSMDGFSGALLEDYAGKLDEQGKEWLKNIRASSLQMSRLIDDILKLSRVIRAEIKFEEVNLSEIAQAQVDRLRETKPARRAEFVIASDMEAEGDRNLLSLVLQNLVDNAFKFTSKSASARIEIGLRQEHGARTYFVRDNGTGFDMQFADKLFKPFQRLHKDSDYPGTGIGLATVQKIIQRHGGRVWAEGELNKGATFYFTLGEDGR